MHTYIYKSIPTPFNSTWLTNFELRNSDKNDNELQNLRNDYDLYIPFVRTDQLARLPLFNLPKILNALPIELESVSSKTIFSSQLKISPLFLWGFDFLNLTKRVTFEGQIFQIFDGFGLFLGMPIVYGSFLFSMN